MVGAKAHVANRIDEDHQANKGHHEQHDRRERIDPGADLKPGRACGNPLGLQMDRILIKLGCRKSAKGHAPADQPRNGGRADADAVAKLAVLLGEQDDHNKSQKRKQRDQPSEVEEKCSHRFPLRYSLSKSNSSTIAESRLR